MKPERTMPSMQGQQTTKKEPEGGGAADYLVAGQVGVKTGGSCVVLLSLQ
jgi:hypothetical protein